MFSTTQITREGLAAGPDMTNRKPYRTKSQKALARKTAYRREDGSYAFDNVWRFAIARRT